MKSIWRSIRLKDIGIEHQTDVVSGPLKWKHKECSASWAPSPLPFGWFAGPPGLRRERWSTSLSYLKQLTIVEKISQGIPLYIKPMCRKGKSHRPFLLYSGHKMSSLTLFCREGLRVFENKATLTLGSIPNSIDIWIYLNIFQSQIVTLNY